MAEKTNPDETAVDGATVPAKKSMLGKLLVLGLVLLVVVVECVVAYLCIPTASNSAVAASNAAKPPADHKKGETEPAEGENDGMIEVDLSEYSVTKPLLASNTTLRIDFHLTGILSKDDEKDFKKLFEENKARFREQVNVAVRGAEMADLSDPGLGFIKRTILDKVNAIHNRRFLKEVLITEFACVEN